MTSMKMILAGLIGLALITIGLGAFLMITSLPLLAVEEGVAGAGIGEGALRWGFAAAAASAALSAAAGGYAVAKVGSAAVGALAEKPELFGRIIILVGLAEGIAIYGLIVAILILNRLA